MARIIERSCVDEYLTKIRQGESSALEQLYEETSKPLYALCYTYMHNAPDSEEALSETYLLAVRNVKKFRGEKGFNWLYTIAKNVCINMIKKKAKCVYTDFNDEESVTVLGLKAESPPLYDESGIISVSQKLLSEKEFRILILHAVNGLKFKEIGQIVGGLESTVRWQYNNAIKKVKSEYERREAREG